MFRHGCASFLPSCVRASRVKSCALTKIDFGGARSCTAGGDGEGAVGAGDAFDELILDDVECVVFGGAAIIFEGFGARGFAAEGSHREIADLHAFGSGEENHIGWIVIERVAEAAFVDDERTKAGAFGFDGASESSGAGADADEVVRWMGVRGGHRASVRRRRRRIQLGIGGVGKRVEPTALLVEAAQRAGCVSALEARRARSGTKHWTPSSLTKG